LYKRRNGLVTLPLYLPLRKVAIISPFRPEREPFTGLKGFILGENIATT